MNDFNEKMLKYRELLQAYRKRFGTGINTFAFDNNIEKIIKAIKDCLASGKPYQYSLPPNAEY